MTDILSWYTKRLGMASSLDAALSAAHSLRYHGARRTLVFAALALGLPAVGEYVGVNRAGSLRHHTQPQVKGVPVGAVLSWYVIGYSTFSLVESIWRSRIVTRKGRLLLLPVSTAVTATSLDLLLDCFGLDLGMWEWTENGTYARDIKGPNGRRGIPLVNFGGWLALTGGVSLAYLLLTSDVTQEGSGPSPESREAGRQAAYLLLPYYLPAVCWALLRRKPRYLVYSAVFPLMLGRALSGGRKRET